MQSELLFAALRDFQVYILAMAFGLARFSGLMLLMPLFSRVRLTGLLRNALGLGFAVPAIPMIVSVLDRSEMTTTFVIAYLMKEVIVGLTIGLAMGVPFWAAEAAGDILDLQRGSTLGSLIDPMMTHETSATGTLLTIVMVALYLAAAGLEITLHSVYASYDLWPIDRFLPIFSSDTGAIFLGLLDRIFSMALTMVFPLVICILLSDIVLAFVARASPQLNVFALSLIVKTLVFSLVFVLYAAFLIAYMHRELGFLNEVEGMIKTIACIGCE